MGAQKATLKQKLSFVEVPVSENNEILLVSLECYSRVALFSLTRRVIEEESYSLFIGRDGSVYMGDGRGIGSKYFLKHRTPLSTKQTFGIAEHFEEDNKPESLQNLEDIFKEPIVTVVLCSLHEGVRREKREDGYRRIVPELHLWDIQYESDRTATIRGQQVNLTISLRDEYIKSINRNLNQS